MKASEVSSTGTPQRTSPATCGTRPDIFSLDGPSRRLDPRTHAYRADIADIGLAGSLFAPHYARPETCHCTADAVSLRARPSLEAPAVSQIVFGEGFAVVDIAGGWAWGRCLHDDYVGYVPADSLSALPAPTHRIVAPLALVFATASIKAPLTASYPMGSLIGGEEIGDFLRTATGFIHLRHLVPVGQAEPDPVTVAESLIGSPYLWGGRGGGGIDCSGLVQRALGLAGIAAPRDSDQQRDGLGDPIPDGEPLRRGDLVFFPGHVGLMVDGDRLIHANAYWMAVTVEPLADLVARLSTTHEQPVTARRRLS